MHRPGIELYRSMRDDKWRYLVKAANGQEVAGSIAAWPTKKAAHRAARRFLRVAHQIRDYWIDTRQVVL